MSPQSPPEPRPADDVVCKLKRSPAEYMLDRVQQKINRYAQKAYWYRRGYYVLATTAAVGAAVAPVLFNIEGIDRGWPTGVAVAVAVAVALEGVFHTRDHWRNYDLISAYLREEEMRFSSGAEPYEDEAKAFKTFVARVEEAIGKERAETIERRTRARESE